MPKITKSYYSLELMRNTYEYVVDLFTILSRKEIICYSLENDEKKH
jgi:hypothetical protein